MAKKYYVSMHDTMLSGWGGASGKKAMYVVECNTENQANLIAKNAKRRGDMKNIRITRSRPEFDSKGYHVSRRKFADLGGSWKSK